MNLTTTARHFETDSQLMEHIEERVLRLKRYFDQILNVDVIIAVEKFRHLAEINVHVNGHNFNAKEESGDMMTSIDKATKSLERQIKKFKERLKVSHQKTKRIENNLMPQELVIKAESVGSESGIEIMDPISHEIYELSIEEATMSLEKGEKDFFLFKDSKTGRISFIYKRSDGDYGVIDTQ